MHFQVSDGSLPASEDITITVNDFFIRVTIDIKPGSYPNSINLGSEGVVPVAILGSASLNVADINQSSLTFEGATARVKGKSGNIGSFEDVNKDGIIDLVVQFATADLQLTQVDIEATLDGYMKTGVPIRGTDSVRIVPP